MSSTQLIDWQSHSKKGGQIGRPFYIHGWMVCRGRMDAQERRYPWMDGMSRAHGCARATISMDGWYVAGAWMRKSDDD